MNNHHLRVADGWSSDDKASRLHDLLDGELLPRLERPGCYLGLRAERIVDAPTAATRTVFLWPNEPETFRRPDALGPLDDALRQLWGCEVDYATVPTLGLRDSLKLLEAPYFSCPAWRPLSAYDLWVVWIEQPAQILGLLSIFESAAVPMRATVRRESGGSMPRVLVAGPAAVDGFALARVYADALLPNADASSVADMLAGLASSENIATALAQLVERGDALASLDAESGSGSVDQLDAAELNESLPRSTASPSVVLPIHLTRELVTTQRDGAGVLHTNFYVWAAGAALRDSLGLASSAVLDAALSEALREDGAQLHLHFALGLPGETDGDRAAIAEFVRHAAKRAAPRPKRVHVNVSAYAAADAPRRDGRFEAEQLARVETALAKHPGRVSLARAGEGVAASLILAGRAEFAPVVELLHAAGARSRESGLACATDMWDKAMQQMDLGASDSLRDASASGPESQDASASASDIGLGLFQCPPEDKSGDDTEQVDRADRWRRWSSIVPHQFDYRVEFSKRGRMRHLSHRELADLILSACREAHLPVAKAGIVAPRPKLSFGPSLPVGVEGLQEYVDIGLTQKTHGLVSILNERLPDGICVQDARFVPGGGGRNSLGAIERAEYELRIAPQCFQQPTGAAEEIRRRIEAFRSDAEQWQEATNAETIHQLLSIESADAGCEDGSFMLRFALDMSTQDRKLKLTEVIERFVGDLVTEPKILRLRRVRMLAASADGGELSTPMEQALLRNRRLRAVAKQCA